MTFSPSLFDLAFPDSPDLVIERKHAKSFDGRLCGVDEAGRGPWAGPVVTAAVILDYDRVPVGLNDSKKLTEARREELFEQIVATAHVSLASASPATIDAVNIRTATLSAMVRAVNHLPLVPDYVLVDGRDVPHGLKQAGQALIKGDGRCLCVAAASIVAKVTRDRMMVHLDASFPDYGFAQHKGYGVPQHQAALERHGPTVHHRLSFKPVRLAAGS
ncbi:ribonuclease HII [Labrenzia sp. PO1]|uniref:ribonuclease HII n=1 Tax=Stappiaceae TaxID=2821832 RepID=UPI001447D83C|nr:MULTISPECIES: ribonuclease HII [Stappiaceae]NKI58725.1 ribonuclease HII [Labrenzia sp. PO1]UES52457.1 ribonuclease HII [Roseibium aggregatum]